MLPHPGLICPRVLLCRVFVFLFPACVDFLSAGAKVTPCAGHVMRKTAAVNGGAAETRYGDRRFSAELVRHYRWAFMVVSSRLLSLFNLENGR